MRLGAYIEQAKYAFTYQNQVTHYAVFVAFEVSGYGCSRVSFQRNKNIVHSCSTCRVVI